MDSVARPALYHKTLKWRGRDSNLCDLRKVQLSMKRSAEEPPLSLDDESIEACRRALKIGSQNKPAADSLKRLGG